MTGYTYFVQRADGLIRIDHTAEPEIRQSGLEEPLEFLIAAPDDMLTLEDARSAFVHLKSRGFWYRPEDDLMEFMAKLADEEVDLPIIRGDERWINVDEDVGRLIAIRDANVDNPMIWNRCNTVAELLRNWSVEPDYVHRGQQVQALKHFRREFHELGVRV